MCPFCVSCPFPPWLPQWQEVPAPLVVTAVPRDVGRSFYIPIHTWICPPSALLPSDAGATSPSFAHGPFLLVSRALGTLVPGEAEPAENALCLPPGQPWPSQAPAPCCARPGSSAGSGPYPTAPSSGCASAQFRHELAVASSAREFCHSQPAPPPASTTPATSRHSQAAFLAPSRCPRLGCTVPKLGTNFPLSLVLPPLHTEMRQDLT